MHLRQDDGEIAPATWLGGAVTAVTLGGVVLLAERQIGTAPAFSIFWCGCALAALCLFGAGRQHFINIGRARALAGSVPASAGPAHTTPTSAPEKKPAKIEFISTEWDANLSIFADGVVRWSPSHGPAHFIERGLVVAFRHAGGRDVAVNAHLTFVSQSSGAQVRVNYGTWLGSTTRTELFYTGDTHELVVATVERARACITFEDARENAGSGNIAGKYLTEGRYAVKVELDMIDEDSGEVIPKSFDFDVVLDALNLDLCSISRA